MIVQWLTIYHEVYDAISVKLYLTNQLNKCLGLQKKVEYPWVLWPTLKSKWALEAYSQVGFQYKLKYEIRCTGNDF